MAVNVAVLVLVYYGHVSAARTRCGRHYSSSGVVETLNIHLCHIEGCCNNQNGMPPQNFCISSVVGLSRYFRFFTDGIQLIFNIFANHVHMIIKTTGWIKEDAKIPRWSHTWRNG